MQKMKKKRLRIMINHFEMGNEIVNGVEVSFEKIVKDLEEQSLKIIRKRRNLNKEKK